MHGISLRYYRKLLRHADLNDVTPEGRRKAASVSETLGLPLAACLRAQALEEYTKRLNTALLNAGCIENRKQRENIRVELAQANASQG
jgi:hypothetical protein